MSSRCEAVRHILPTPETPPEAFSSLTLDQWDLVIRLARRAGILARLCFLLADSALLDHVPERPRAHLEAARTLALKHQRDVRWEVASVHRVLEDSGVPMILLKGAAYVMADLPPARGRLFSDIDFMVPRDRIEEVERILLDSDWISTVKDDYDQNYYRRWTHQIPPLQHYKRSTVLDIHHTIIEVTARTAVDADILVAESAPVEGNERLRVLAPPDMVLHSALHLFNAGEFDRGLRDLLDLCDLLDHFGREAGFLPYLAERSEALGLTRPLFLMLRYRQHFFGFPVPDELRDFVAHWAPSVAKRAYYDTVFPRALLPNHKCCDDRFTATARWLLYVRSHYLRMPLHLLAPHLLRKWVAERMPDPE